MKKWILVILLNILLSSLCYSATNRPIYILSLTEAINPASAGYIHRNILKANQEHAALVILYLDTDGGIEKSAIEIVKDILNSSVPVVSYVAPTGAYSAHQGLTLIYASSIAAMAPGTHLGDPTNNEPLDHIHSIKYKITPNIFQQNALNKVITTIQQLATFRHRNADWAEAAFRGNMAAISAEEALNKKIINLIAADLPQLLQKLDGMTIDTQSLPIVLSTQNTQTKVIETTWQDTFVSIITNPILAYLLLLIGILTLFFNFLNPRKGFLGFFGIISLIVALYAFHLLPVNFFGLTLLLIGIACMIAETTSPGFGIAGTCGIIIFILGSILLLDLDTPGYYLSPLILLLLTFAIASLFFLVLSFGIKRKIRKK